MLLFISAIYNQILKDFTTDTTTYEQTDRVTYRDAPHLKIFKAYCNLQSLSSPMQFYPSKKSFYLLLSSNSNYSSQCHSMSVYVVY